MEKWKGLLSQKIVEAKTKLPPKQTRTWEEFLQHAQEGNVTGVHGRVFKEYGRKVDINENGWVTRIQYGFWIGTEIKTLTPTDRSVAYAEKHDFVPNEQADFQDIQNRCLMTIEERIGLLPLRTDTIPSEIIDANKIPASQDQMQTLRDDQVQPYPIGERPELNPFDLYR